jgi:hypothetical protein
MPRQKGPGVIKYLDPTKQDDVTMRQMLWRGAPLDDKLNDLYTKRAELTVQLINLRTVREGLRRVVSGENPTMKKLDPPMLRANARMELRGVEPKINATEMVLHSIEEQIEEIKKTPRARQRKAVCRWQQRAVQLIMLHKFNPQPLTSLPYAPRAPVKTQGMFPMPIVERERRPKIRPPKSANADQDRKQRTHAAAMAEQERKKKNEREDKVLSTQGTTITTDELQRQLRSEGFKVGVRELRRFMRQCGVAGQQGRRSDLQLGYDGATGRNFGQ